MTEPLNREAPPDAPLPESTDLFDYALIRAWLGFGLGSLRRHWLRALLACAFPVVTAAVAVAVLPRSYHTETTMMAERNQVLPALSNPGRSIPRDADSPARAASETVMSHENLVALIKQTNLVEKWEHSLAPAQQLKSFIQSKISKPTSQEQKVEALVGLLEKQLKVTTEEPTVTIGLDWNEANMTFQLVEAAKQNFIETRHALELATISEAISILEWHVSKVRENLQGLLEQLRDAKRPAAPGAPNVAASTARPMAVPNPIPTRDVQAEQEIAQLKGALAARQHALEDLEEFRRKRLAELKARIDTQSAIYAPAHPVIVELEASMAALTADSPQIESLRQERDSLEKEIAARRATATARATRAAAPTAGTAATLTPDTGSDPSDLERLPPRAEANPKRKGDVVADQDDAAGVEYLNSMMKIEVVKYQDLVGRLDAARIELETARAAFKYRYGVIRPAQIPKQAEKPKPALLIAGGLVAGLLLGLFAAISTDVRSGRVLEPWQIERVLGVQVLAVLRKA